MRKQTRTNLFIFFVFIFFASIPAIVLYTQGYRIDFAERRLVETGGIDLEIRPTDTKIFVNEKFSDQTNFLFPNFLLRNIFSGDYAILIEKEGYQNWQKTLTVEEGRVIQVKNIRLFKELTEIKILAEKTEYISIADDARYALLVIKNKETDARELNLIQLENESSRTLLTLKKYQKVRKVSWSVNSENFLILTSNSGSYQLYTGSIKDTQEIINWDSFLKAKYPSAYNQTTELRVSNQLNELLIFTLNRTSSAYTLTIAKNSNMLEKNILNKITSFTLKDNNLFYINSSGRLTKASLSGVPIDTLAPTILTDHANLKAQIIIRDDKKVALVIISGALYLWQEDELIEKIAETNILGASFAPDKDKFVYWNKNEIIVQWTKEIFGPPKRIIGDTEIINEFSGIISVRWLEDRSAHLIIELADNITIAELDSRGERNIAKFNTNALIIAFDNNTQKLYLRDMNNIFVLPLE